MKEFPFSIEGNLEPVYTELPGWQKDMSGIRSESELPDAFRTYLNFLEKTLQVPIKIVSVGPDRMQTIMR